MHILDAEMTSSTLYPKLGKMDAVKSVSNSPTDFVDFVPMTLRLYNLVLHPKPFVNGILYATLHVRSNLIFQLVIDECKSCCIVNQAKPSQDSCRQEV